MDSELDLAKIVALQREINIRKARENLWAYCCIVSPDFYKGDRWHLWLICETLQALYERRLTKGLFWDICHSQNVPSWYADTVNWDRLADGVVYTKLMINMPPRHGKSRTLVNFCDWILGEDKHNKIITVSYNTDAATDQSRYVRDGIMMKKNLPTDIVYSDIFPASKIAKGNSSFMKWSLEGCFFNYLGAGLEGTLTGRGGNCLVGDTLIETRDFGYKPVDWIHLTKSTIFVKSYDEKENKVVWNMVEASKKSIVNKLVYIKTVSGKYITCTIEHEIWSEGKYVIAGLLRPAMKVFVSNGFGIREDVISGVNIFFVKNTNVYDLQIRNTKNMFANGILCHNCTIIDDPLKSAEDSYNDRVLEGLWNWYTGTFMSRAEKEGDGSIDIINNTRWNTKDLCGRVMDSKMGESWLQLSIPVEHKGNLLCPSILPQKDFEELRDNMDPNIFRANYYQEPIDIKGRLFEQILTYDELPPNIEKFIAYIDTADEGTDYLACIMGGIKEGRGYVTDIYFTQDSMAITEPETARRLVVNKINDAKIESNNGGKGFARNVERLIWETYKTRQVNISWFHQTENKMARILTGSTFVMKNIFFPSDWAKRWPEFYLSIMSFQKSGGNKHDDGVEALVEWGKMITGDGSINSYIEMMKKMKEGR
jgi:predicted phage terminase large subunit-like protein